MKTNETPNTAEDGQETVEMESSSKNKELDPTRFDLESLRLGQDFGELAGVEKMTTTIPVRKPSRQEFVRVHTDEAYRMQTATLTWQEDREVYLLARDLWNELPGEIVPVELFTAVNRQGVVFIWPVRLPGHDGKWNPWHRSAMDCAQQAMTLWVRLAANMSLGAYEIFVATTDLPEPEWPNLSFEDMLQIAFRDHFIETLDHPVCRRLRGAL